MSEENQLSLEQEVEAPNSVKSGVGSSLNFLRFASDLIDLYVVKAGDSFLGFMSNFEMQDANDSEKKSEN